MAQDEDPTAIARAIIDANLYMVVGTADATGLPWVSPVYYAPAQAHPWRPIEHAPWRAA